jgi:transcriptional regulator with XRE-family HTH domain
MKIGSVLEGWRKREGLTVNTVANEIGIPPDTYRRLELGSSPQWVTVLAILRWLLVE